MRPLTQCALLATLILAHGCAKVAPAPQPAAVTLAAVQHKLETQPAQPLNQADVFTLLVSEQYGLLDRYFSGVQRAYVNGTITDEELRNAFRAFYGTNRTLEPKYDDWVRRFPRSYVARLARGIHYKKLGQERRGTDFIGKTSLLQIAGMELAYGKALEDFHASEGLNEKPLLSYVHAIDISSQAGDTDANRETLDAAVRVDPNNLVVRQKYMIGLEPRWGGSLRQMQDFLEECRRANLPAEHLRKLESVIVTDRAQAQYDSGNYAAAADGFREALDMGSEVVCLECAGYAMADQNRHADAIRVYSMILQDTPSDAATLAKRAYAYSKLEDPKALDDFTTAANLGDAYSQNQLGKYSLNGVPGIVPRDRDQALEWFQKAAAQGDAEGIKNLSAALASK